MLHNAPTYIFAALSAIAATALATWQVGLVLANSTAAIDPALNVCPSDGKRYAAVDSLLMSSVHFNCWAYGVLLSLHSGCRAMQIVNHIQHYSSPIFQVRRVSTVQDLCMLSVARRSIRCNIADLAPLHAAVHSAHHIHGAGVLGVLLPGACAAPRRGLL
jgi:hypothetical protein